MIKHDDSNLSRPTTIESHSCFVPNSQGELDRRPSNAIWLLAFAIYFIDGSPLVAQFDNNQCYDSSTTVGDCPSGGSSETRPDPTCGKYGKTFDYSDFQSSFPSLYGSRLTTDAVNSGSTAHDRLHDRLHDAAPCNTMQAAMQGSCFSNGSRPLTIPAEVKMPCGTNCEAGRLLAGFEALWFRSNFDQNVAMIIDPVPGNRLVPFDYDFHFSPRVWLGWLSPCNGGFRSSYFHYDATAQRETATAVPNATPVYLFVYGAGGNLTRNAYADLGETLSTIHSTNLQALDLEYVDTFSLKATQCLAGAGVRFAKMGQVLRGDVYNSGGGLQEVVTNELDFTGTGPTLSLQAWRPFFNRRFSAYASPRGTLLFSKTHQSIYEMKDAGANEVRDQAHQQEIISVIEMGLGLQYNVCLSNGPSWYIRGGYEVQAWYDVGGPIDSTSTLGLDGVSFLAGTIW